MIGRRQLLGAAVAGIAVGFGGAAITKSEASMRFIGRDRSILALLDTGIERALFVLGDPDESLLANTPGLTTIGGSRIDLIVATHRTLAADFARANLPLDSSQILSVQTDSSLAPIQGSVHLASQSTLVELGDTTLLEVIPAIDPADHPDFLVELECLGRNIIIASSASALRMASTTGHDLLVLPGITEAEPITRVQPQVVVCNGRSDENLATPQIEVFSSDPVVVQIGAEGIAVRRNQLSS